MPSPLFLQVALDATTINILMFGLLLVIFYFFLIRPQNQRQKAEAAFQEALKKNDKVVTSSGILGRVSKVDKDESTVTLEVSKNVYIDFTAGSISKQLTDAKYGAPDSK